jgi:cholesterol transport system auxiliary component
MTPPRRRFGFAALAATLLLTACAGTPPQLYRLTPKSTFPPDLPHVPTQLLIDTPLAPAGLDTRRIALSRSPVSIGYFADSAWTDRAPAVVQTALLESFENSGAVTALDRESVGLKADFVLKTEIRHFEAVYDAAAAAPEVWVAIEARLVAMPRGAIVAQRPFEAHQRAAANELPQIVLAFDGALGAVIKRLVVWSLANPALSEVRR